MNTVSIVVSKAGVFQDWLKDHPDAAVVVEEDDLSDDQDDFPQSAVLEDQEDEATEDGGEDSTPRADSRASNQSYSKEEERKSAEERLKRLVKLIRWNPAVPKVGPYSVLRTSNTLRLQDLRSVLYHMEDSTDLNSLERFKKFRDDGYLLIKGVYNTTNGGAKLLEVLRKDITRLVKKEYGLVLDSKTLEELREPDAASKKRKLEVDKTVRVYPELSESEEEAEGDWFALGESGKAALNSAPIEALVESFVTGACQFHNRLLKVEKRFSWVRLRGRLNPRKEWSEYYYMRDNATAADEGKWDKRFARELTRRMDNPKPRYGFSAWVAAGPNPIDGGNMALLPGSHQYSGFLKPPRGEETPYEFKKQAREMPWVLDDLEAGDVLLIDMQTVRAFVSNKRHPHFIGAFIDHMYVMEEKPD